MITVTIFCSGEKIVGFESEGHADYADEGYDIVCSAVSALTVNTVNSIETFTQDSFEGEEDPEGGYLKVLVDGEISDWSQLLLRSLKLGLDSIAESYGEEFLRVTQMDVSDPEFLEKFPPETDEDDIE